MITENSSYNQEFLSRFLMMLTDEQKNNLLTSHVILFGVGGVGGSVAKMLVRSGIQNLAIVDFDDIDVSNINRQVVANANNIGKIKVEELALQLKEINPFVNIEKFNIKLSQETIDKFNLAKYDYIIDCIDDLPAKKLLILTAKTLKKPILCAMGAGNRFEGIPAFEIADIKKTSYDPIAKILRKFCVEQRINKLDVCYTKQKATKFDCKIIGSVIYYTMNMATVMCAKVINDILRGNNESNNN